ncbi:MAG: hypothetical protein OXN84_19150 [Albidovulum sp.]|nr:hypothetical protein [Albidovulum sp.]
MGTLSNYRTVGLAEMAQAIRDNRAHRCSLEMALHAVDAMTSILKAGEENRWCELSTSCARPEPFGRAEAQSLLA